MRIWKHAAAASAIAATARLASAADPCFFNSDWTHIVAGQPLVVAWRNDFGGFWDVLLNADVRSQASVVGAIARNITQSAVVWLPPADISDGNANRLFAVQLWDLARGTTCNSPSFTIKAASDQQPAAQLPSASLLTTSVSMISGAVLATATVASSFATGLDASYSSAIPTPTASTNPDEPETSTGPSLSTLIVGIVIGILVLIVIVLSVLFWRAKRNRTRRRGSLLPSEDGKGAGHSSMSLDTSSPAMPSTPIELDAKDSPVEAQAAEMRHEMAVPPTAPVELPAELPSGLTPATPSQRCQSLVSDITAHQSRRSSIERFPVSPADAMTPRRRSLTKK